MPRRAEFDIQFKPETYRNGMSAQSPTASPVEIARIQFKSGNLKQVRILARTSENGFCYEIGKDDAEAYDATPRWTSSPLTFGELVDMIEDCVHPQDIRRFNLPGRTIGQMVGFIDASSSFYPELSAWYKQEATEWLRSKRLYFGVNIFLYSTIALAAVFSVTRVEALTFGKTDLFVLAYFSLSVLSLTWAVHRKHSLIPVLRWLTVGIAAFIVAQGIPLSYCAWLMTGGALLYLIVGLGSDLANEAYTPRRRYRFSGIGHPNWQAETCSLLLLSTAYLHSAGLMHTAVWIPLMLFAVTLLLLTRSRTCFWVTVATTILWIALQLYFSTRPTGWFMLLAIVAGARASMVYFGSEKSRREPAAEAPVQKLDWKEKTKEVVHLGRDPVVRNNLGGRSGVWRYVLQAIREKPLLGYGHGSFWTPERARETVQILGWCPGSSHSIYLDSLLNAGPASLLLLLTVLAYAASYVSELNAPNALFLACFLSFAALQGLLESTYSTPNFRCFSLFLMICALT